MVTGAPPHEDGKDRLPKKQIHAIAVILADEDANLSLLYPRGKGSKEASLKHGQS